MTREEHLRPSETFSTAGRSVVASAAILTDRTTGTPARFRLTSASLHLSDASPLKESRPLAEGVGTISALGQKRKSQAESAMSALPSEADIVSIESDVRYVPA
jgi:hypothetical protein